MVQNAENTYFTILEIHVRSLYLVLGTWLKYPKEEKYIFRICYHAHSPDICKWRVRGLLLDTFFSFQKYCKDKQAIQKCVCFTFLIETSWALPPFGRYCPQPLMITVQEKQILFYTFYLGIQYCELSKSSAVIERIYKYCNSSFGGWPGVLGPNFGQK